MNNQSPNKMALTVSDATSEFIRKIERLNEVITGCDGETKNLRYNFTNLNSDYCDTKSKVNELEKHLHDLKVFVIVFVICMLVSVLTGVAMVYSIHAEYQSQTEQMVQLQNTIELYDSKIQKLEDEIDTISKQRTVSTSFSHTFIHTTNLSESSKMIHPLSNTTETNVYEPDISNIDIDSSNNISGLTADQFNELIDIIAEHRNIDNCVFTGTGKYFVEVEETYGINGLYLLAIFTKESSFGEIMIRDNNAGGLTKGGKYCTFDSISECILYLGNLLRIYDETYNLQTFEEIGSRYCEGNDDWISDNEEICELYAEFAYKNICSST